MGYAKNSDEIELEFIVKDSGIGIPEEKLETIFNPFSQADGSATRRYGGTGLGLTISSQLAKLMGGNILAESKPDEGATLHFSAVFGVAESGRSLLDMAPHSKLLHQSVFNCR